ncbi:topoisomerase-4 subunit B [Andreprevotia lacus DSM 23236]|jgi:topoisomerase-4 subunit B|uniref:DNA topoisomerase 4 subunit B n=1 Tax=Andreprevotia lacus DSM 23236 TaxID=1121001 RepID=A0A1W1XC21_9NEIS|nr:DNA topoisomerase IV subunit B [Andreprevotia lacus]SMC21071.1 topoisomerase-4 subunit B [Andreprevotia lacus DSM 23236]
MSTPRYDESAVKVLKGLDPVRHRPGMYTRTDNPLHICQEVIDNAADEALGGFAKSIAVTLYRDQSMKVVDNGRGIPVGIHPEEGVPTVQVVFTQLHAGGKFDKKDGGAYAFSGGLHGVGVSVTNALSTLLQVEVKRDGEHSRIVFADGEVREPLSSVGSVAKKDTGTIVTVRPDPKYFDSPTIPQGELEHLLKSKAVLLPGLVVTLDVETANGEFIHKEWNYPDGLTGYLAEQIAGYTPITPILTGEKYIDGIDETFSKGEGCAWALSWTEDGLVNRESYVNLIPTPAGGTHESGLRDGVFQAVKTFIEFHSLLPKGVKLLPEDLFGRCSFVLSAKVLDPQFQGQTKDKLTSRDGLKLVSTMVKAPFELWLNEHVELGKKLAELAIRAAQSRQKNATKVEKKKSSGVAVLPGKLTDCASDEGERCELFLVEGDSAGGSAKLGRDKDFQAILPLRGKVLNTWEVDKDQIFANNEVHDIAVALGVDPHGPNDTPDLSGLRYGKLIIMSDADVDGSHIQVLLLTLFYRHFPGLIAQGHVFVAQPPLYRVDVAGSGKAKPPRKFYALDEGELTAILDKLRAEKIREGAWSISRFKGLGEMNAEQLFETTMNPDTRRVLRVGIPADVSGNTRELMNMLMGKGEASSRRAWLEARGNEVEADL